MDPMQNLSQLLQSQSISLKPEVVVNLESFAGLVVRYNQKANLISEGDQDKIFSRHILDSLQPLRQKYLIPDDNAKWADLGSGAGFPVIPLCIALPTIQFFAVEPRQKRYTFLKVVKAELSLRNLTIIEGNAETSRLENLERVSCRALGSAPEDWERAESMLQPNGLFVTLKSLHDCEPLAQPPWNIHPYNIPGESKDYCLLVRKKVYG
jgi:16S rRNA (guanine527-N7)-methyltransferase